MRRMTLRRHALPVLLAVPVLGMLTLGSAAAHVGGSPSSAPAGTSTVFTLSVPHGCAGSPTTRLEISVPEQLLAVTPTRTAGWRVEIVREELEEPVVDGHGNEVTDRVDRIVYTARESLPDGQRDTFELAFAVPDTPGDVLAFPTVQTCEEGETAWIEVPADGQDAHDLDAPAPTLEVVAADPAGTGSDGADTVGTGANDPEDEGPDLLGWAGLVAGLLGLAAGLTALARRR